MALFQRGGLNLGRIGGVSLRLHWTLLVAPFVFTGLKLDAVAWATFFALLVAHQLGHAGVVKAAGGTATLVEL
ncbi:MAG: hypothetical protein JNK82_37415, partial [Myxococcaceae bacterium]|nr:hypothetical protein [Myxococcaceae bacterium]